MLIKAGWDQAVDWNMSELSFVRAYSACVSEVDKPSRDAIAGAIMQCQNIVKAPAADPESRERLFGATMQVVDVRDAGLGDQGDRQFGTFRV